MPTFGSAKIAEESDPEDSDFENESGSPSEAESVAPRGKKRRPAVPKQVAEKATEQATAIWNDMLLEQAEQARRATQRRPPTHLGDPLWRQLQRRHAPPKKDCSKKAVLEHLAKYCCGLAVTEQEVAAAAALPGLAAEVRRQVRQEAAEARREAAAAAAATLTSAEAAVAAAASAAKAAADIVVEDTVRFAGQKVTVKRTMQAGSMEAKEHQRAQAAKRPKKDVQLGGQLGALDAFLAANSGEQARDVTVVEKSGLDWAQHRDAAGLDSHALTHDRSHAGALDRQSFLARAAFREEAGLRAKKRADDRKKESAARAAEAKKQL